MEIHYANWEQAQHGLGDVFGHSTDVAYHVFRFLHIYMGGTAVMTQIFLLSSLAYAYTSLFSR